MKQQIVSVSGVIGSGKDTIGEYLEVNHGFTRMSWASTLKDAVAAIFSWDREALEGATTESRKWRTEPDVWWTNRLNLGIPITPRWVLQNIGTEVMRHHFHPEIWILSLSKKIAQHGGRIVVTDTRFLNEMAALRDMGALLLGVHRVPPAWLAPFYKAIENYGGKTVHNMKSADDRKYLVSLGDLGMLGVPSRDRAHESEWQHVLWNDYDKVIDNTGSLKATYLQVERALRQHG